MYLRVVEGSYSEQCSLRRVGVASPLASPQFRPAAGGRGGSVPPGWRLQTSYVHQLDTQEKASKAVFE